MQDTVTATDGGVLLRVELSPNADEDAFPAGYNEWRGRVKARVREPPTDGQANRALRGLVAERLGVGADAVRVEHGHTSSKKTLRVAGLSPAEVEAALGGVLET